MSMLFVLLGIFEFIFVSFLFVWASGDAIRSHKQKKQNKQTWDIENVVISLLLLLMLPFPFDTFNIYIHTDIHATIITFDVRHSIYWKVTILLISNSCRSHKWKRTENSNECNICHASITKINYTSKRARAQEIDAYFQSIELICFSN